MDDSDRLWMDAFGFVYSGEGKRLLKGANVKGAYWIPEGVEEIDPGALIGCQIGTLHVPWGGSWDIALMVIGCCLSGIHSRTRNTSYLMGW